MAFFMPTMPPEKKSKVLVFTPPFEAIIVLQKKLLVPTVLMTTLISVAVGCVAKVDTADRPIFKDRTLDACLVLNVDLSQSFANDFGDRAFPLLMKVTTEYFQSQAGAECKVVIAQTSANDDTILFEGTPRQLRSRFNSPDQFSTFLLSKSDPNRSPIFRAFGNTIAYANDMPDVDESTTLLTVMISDMVESETDDAKRKADGRQMLRELEAYRESGGGVALYFVSLKEVDRWNRIFESAGFERGQYVIANTLADDPPMPSLD